MYCMATALERESTAGQTKSETEVSVRYEAGATEMVKGKTGAKLKTSA
jgi:hypothetical protein